MIFTFKYKFYARGEARAFETKKLSLSSSWEINARTLAPTYSNPQWQIRPSSTSGRKMPLRRFSDCLGFFTIALEDSVHKTPV